MEMVKKMAQDVIEELSYPVPVLLIEDANSAFTSPQYLPHFGTEENSMIMFPISHFRDWVEIDKQGIEIILKHEYGHHLTLDDLNKDLLHKEKFKKLVFDLILYSLQPSFLPERILAEQLYFHHSLFSEQIATVASGLTIADISRVIEHQTGYTVSNDIPLVNITALKEKDVSFVLSDILLPDIPQVILEFISGVIDDSSFIERLTHIVNIWLSSWVEDKGGK